MTLTDFFQGNREREINKTLSNVATIETDDPFAPTTIDEFISALNGSSSVTTSSSSLPVRDRFTDLSMRIDDIESRITGIESDAITDVMARLADINERLGALEASRR